MRVTIGGQAINPVELAVRFLGFGQEESGRRPVSYECRVSYDEFWAAVGGDVVEMVRETLEEARLGILTADERWLVEGLSATGGSLADQVRAKPEFAIRVAIECSPQELLLGLFDERSLPKPGYIANNVLAIATAGNDVVFSGEAFVARPPK